MERRVLKNSKKGQSLVEMALILPVLILVLMGIIDFGILFGNYITLTNASREGARNAAVGYSDADISTVVINAASNLNSSKLKITVYPASSLRKKGDEVSVTVEYDNTLLTPIIGAIIPNPVHLKATTVMRME